MVLICISLMISGVEHLFTYLLVICMSLKKNLCSGPLPILNWITLPDVLSACEVIFACGWLFQSMFPGEAEC